MRQRSRTRRLLLMILIVLSACGSRPAAAQTAAADAVAPAALRQIYVPADDPAHWPAGEWIPVDRDDLLELLRPETSASNPEPAFLERVVYRARFDRSEFVDGTLEATVRLRGTRSRFVDLGAPSLAITELRWPQGPAAWGLAADRRSLLRVEAHNRTLSGQWSLSGRDVFSTVSFAVTVPPAVTSRLELDVPATHTLSVDNGLTTEVRPNDRSDRRTWSVELGRRTSCRLNVAPIAGVAADSSRDLQLSQTANYSFIADGLRVQSDITVQSVNGRFDTLDLIVPEAMQSTSVTIGSESALPSTKVQEGDTSLLRVDFSDVGLMRGTTLRLTGKLPLHPGRPQELPSIDVRGGRWMRIRKHVDIARPLQLQDIELADTQMIDASVSQETGGTFDFDDLSASSRIAMNVGTPQPDLTANVSSEADWSQGDPLLRTTLRCEARSGSTYTLTCDIPAGWEVTRVTADSSTPVAQWSTTTSDANHQGRLQIELRKALAPQNPVEVVVWARPLSFLLDDTIEMPVVLPDVTGTRTVDVHLTPPPGVRFSPATDSIYRTIDTDKSSQVKTHPGRLALRATDPTGTQRLNVIRDPKTESATSTPDVSGLSADGDVGNDDRSPLLLPIELETTVAADRGLLCRHRATLRLPPLPASRQLTIRLPQDARFLSCEGMPSEPIEGCGVVVTVPAASEPSASNEPHKLTLTYESPLTQSIISGQADVPLPMWDGAATTIGWRISLPSDYRLRAPTAGSSVQDDGALSWSERLLGPLGRPAAGKFFWPFSVDDWRGLLMREQADTASPGSLSVYDRSTSGGTPALRLSFWNVAAARQTGWLVMCFAILLTAWPFQTNRIISPGWAFRLVLLGCVAAFLSPEFLAIPWGGFVAGALLGALLPNRWRLPARRSTLRRDAMPSTRVVLPLTVTAGLVLLSVLIDVSLCRGWQSSPTAGQAAEVTADDASLPSPERLDVLIPVDLDAARDATLPQVVYVDRLQAQTVLEDQLAAAPAYLLRSARYEVSDFDRPRQSLVARYDVVLLHPQSETPVAIDLAGVLFVDDRACLVDGHVAPLLPRRGREGVVVVVPPTEATADELPTAVAIELTCRPRRADEEGPRLNVGIPAIIDTQARFASQDVLPADVQIGRSGATTPAAEDGFWHVSLGARPYLSANRLVPGLGQRWVEPVEAASVVEAHPLQLQIESRLTFVTQPQWSHLGTPSLRLQLPPHSVVRSVRANGLEQTRTQVQGNGPIQLDLSFEHVPDRELTVAVSFDVPTSGVSVGAVAAIPAIPFLAGVGTPGFPVHLLGVSASRGLRLDAGDPEGMMPGTTGIDETRLPGWRGANSTRTADATYLFDTPRSLNIPLTPIVPHTNATIRQTVTVRPAAVDWSAEVDLTVRDAAVEFHRIAVDPHVNIRQVRLLQDDVDRLASWSRTGPDEIILFLTEELSGTQFLRMKGTLSLEDRQDFELPRLSVQGASLATPPEVRIRRTSDVSVALTSEEGTLVPAHASAQTDDNGLLDVATVNVDDTLPPLRLRVNRGASVLDVEQVTQITSVEAEVVHWVSHLRVASPGVLPGGIEVRLAAPPDDLTFHAEVGASQPLVKNGTVIWTLNAPDTALNAMDVTISGRTPLAVGALPQISVSPGTVKRHVVAIPSAAAIEIDPHSGRGVSVGDLPRWIQQRLTESSNPELIVELTRPAIRLTKLSHADATAFLRRFNSGVWQRLDGSWVGLTVADIVARTDTPVEFAVPVGMVLRSITRDGVDVAVSRDRTQRVLFKRSDRPQRVTLWWTFEGKSGAGVPLPQPVDLGGAVTRVALFGDERRYYRFGSEAHLVGAEELLQELTAFDAAESVPAPIATALLDAGVQPSIEVEPAQARLVGHDERVFGIHLADDTSVVPVHVLDAHLIRVAFLLAAAALGLLLWFVMGGWIERLTPQESSSAGLLGLGGMAAMIWAAGWSAVGFFLMLVFVCTWLITRRRRPVQAA